MHPTPITHGLKDATRRSFAAPRLPLVTTAATGAAPAAARSQRELVQWSLLLFPERGKRRARSG